MGSVDGQGDEREHPQHWVTLSPFYMQEHEVTNAEYRRFDPNHDADAPNDHPVVNVSWFDAMAYAQWLGGSLPTEAQWEFSARGKEGREYPWGNETLTPDRANYGGNVRSTTRVKSYPKGATPEGIYDLAGNVWEWCRDWYGDYRGEEQTDPVGPDSGSFRVLRGGAFYNCPGHLRAAYRINYVPQNRNDRIGFRVVWSAAGGQN